MKSTKENGSRSTFPEGRCGLREFLQIAGISKNTFYLKYRVHASYTPMLDIREDRMHRIHMPRTAAELIAAERASKPPHGNKGRRPHRPCGGCRREMHPRARTCPACGWTPR